MTEELEERLDKLARKLDLVCETPTVLAALEQLDEIEGHIAAGQQRLAVIAEAEAALAQREAALDQRERENKVREFLFDQKVEEATGQLRASYLSLTQADRAMRLRILNHAGWLDGFDPGIREIPSWDALSKIIGATDAIPELQDRPTELVREGFAGDKFSEQSTVTRSMPMAAMASHDDQPTPRPPPVKRPSRRSSYRAAMQRALQRP